MRFGNRKKKAAVLGCGPAGLFAVHALHEKGWDVQIFSKKRKSHMFGAQYLHAPIPGLQEIGPIEVDYSLIGTVEEYREKVYGQLPVTVSPQSLVGTAPAWDIRRAYDDAWERYGTQTYDVNITPDWLGAPTAVSIPENFLGTWDLDLIVSTVPADRMCYQPEVHTFASQTVWAIGDAPERGQYAPSLATAFSVVCNGSRDTGWYRAANVFGHSTVEWPGRRKPTVEGAVEVVKPIATNCDCYFGIFRKAQFLRVGRYGTWTKGYLAHQAYTEMRAL